MTVEPVPLPDGTKRVVEGKVTVVLPAKRLTRRTGVFYNQRMDLNRDLAILFASSHFPTWMRIRVCDPMTGSGVRAARYVLESSNVASVLAADKDPDTVEAARRTIQLNGVDAKVSVLERDANLLLTEHSENRFDLVDLDPFGSPAPFFESALRATNDGGVVAATATDMGPLTGARAASMLPQIRGEASSLRIRKRDGLTNSRQYSRIYSGTSRFGSRYCLFSCHRSLRENLRQNHQGKDAGQCVDQETWLLGILCELLEPGSKEFNGNLENYLSRLRLED